MTMTATDPAAPAPVQGRSLWDDARRRLLRNKAAVVSMVVLAGIFVLAIFGPYIPTHTDENGNFRAFRYEEMDYSVVGTNLGPDFASGHIFGIDGIGRDVFVRTLIGARVSLAVGVVATLVSLTIGILYGATAGFIGGRVDELMMRFVDVLYSMPYIFFVIILMVVFGRNFILIFVAIGAVEWLTMARIVRGQTIALRRKEFVEAARAAGAGPLQIVFRHIVPNVLGPVVVFATLNIPVIILLESFLSFIGLGVKEPLTSLGALISRGVGQIQAPWMLIAPALTMLVTLLALNFLGDGLRDALDPKER